MPAVSEATSESKTSEVKQHKHLKLNPTLFYDFSAVAPASKVC